MGRCNKKRLRNGSLLFLALMLVGAGCAGGKAKSVCYPEEIKQIVESAQPEVQGKVTWKVISKNDQLNYLPPERGGSFMGRAGDYLIENDKIRFIVQQPSRQISPAPYGGNIIDADVVRDDGIWHDILGEISTFIGLAYTMDAQDFDVLRDGSDGVLVLRTSGSDTLLDYINLKSAVESLGSSYGLPLQINLPWDFNSRITATISNYYILRAGSSHVEIYTAVCNRNPGELMTTLGDIIDSGGTVAYFNPSLKPQGNLPGFGYTGNTVNDLTQAPYMGFVGEDSGYLIVPRSHAISLVLSGVAVIQYGATNPLQFILGVTKGGGADGYFTLPKGGSITYARDLIIFDTFNKMVEELYRIKGVMDVGRVQGTVKTAGGDPVEGAKVAFVSESGDLANLLETDANGEFSGSLSAGTYTVYADVPGWPSPPSQRVDVQAGKTSNLIISITSPACIKFNVQGTDPALGPDPVNMPAKVSLRCVDTCPKDEKRLFYDTLYDAFPQGYQVQAFVDLQGKVSIMAKRGAYFMECLPTPPGRYDVIVSRGMEFSIYKERVTLNAGEQIQINAQINRVVDTSGYISADLHVHSVNSPDAPVPLTDRVLTFLGEGVDVLVSTDHDFITDYKPVIESLGAEKYLTTFAGEELTTFDVGHFNGYPLRVSPDAYQGGAVDWAGGRGPNLTPEEIFKALKEKGAIENPIVQVNHPRSPLQGYFTAIKLDTATRKTHADPVLFRMDPSKLNQSEDDTGLFSDLFDAFEIYNSYSDEINQALNDYFTFLNTGFIRTGVAVSDTHHWYSSEAGMPRSFIMVGDEYDTPVSLTPEVFADAIRKGKVVGSNGPFIHFYIEDSSGKKYYMGDMVPTGTGLTLHAEVRMPEWIMVDTLEVFSNTQGTASLNGEGNKTWPTPFTQVRISYADVVTTPAGMRVYNFSMPVTVRERDAWFVVVARDDPSYGEKYPMVPVVASGSELPLAFTNAIFVDGNGNEKYDPPGASPPQTAPPRKESPVSRILTEEEIVDILRSISRKLRR